MDHTETREQVAAILNEARNSKAAVELRDETHLYEDLDVNSADLIDIVLDLEEKFDISISDEDVDKLHTFGDLVSLAVSKSALTVKA